VHSYNASLQEDFGGTGDAVGCQWDTEDAGWVLGDGGKYIKLNGS
jgi:hypothetical protein